MKRFSLFNCKFCLLLHIIAEFFIHGVRNTMNKNPKYEYPKPIPVKNRKWPDNQLKKAPIWCSVDLRDGNQALPIPMTPEKKHKYFNTEKLAAVKKTQNFLIKKRFVIYFPT